MMMIVTLFLLDSSKLFCRRRLFKAALVLTLGENLTCRFGVCNSARLFISKREKI
jgi:hypothetical protein